MIILPVYEVEGIASYYNTAAVIDADGSYLGKYRKHHIPHVEAGEGTNGFWEKYYFRPGNLGYPVFDTAYARVGVYICYDRHFPEGARLLGLAGAEIVFNPSATVAGTSEYLWKLEQPAHAVANGYYVAAINRVGVEAPWNMGNFMVSRIWWTRADEWLPWAAGIRMRLSSARWIPKSFVKCAMCGNSTGIGALRRMSIWLTCNWHLKGCIQKEPGP